MRDASDISARGTMQEDSGLAALHAEKLKLVNIYGHRLQFHQLALARQLVRGSACDLFRRNRWRDLLDLTAKSVEQGFEALLVERNRNLRGSRHPVHVVAVGGVAEVDHSLVGL